MKLRLYMGQRQAEFHQQYEILAKVAGAALGGGKKSEKVAPPKNFMEAQQALKAVFG